MKPISDRELYELYLGTVGHCTSKLLQNTDEEIRYELFEEFEVEVTTFLHENSLAQLQQAGYLTQDLVEASMEIRRRWFELQATSDVAQIKSILAWRELFQLCDAVLARLGRGHTAKDIGCGP